MKTVKSTIVPWPEREQDLTRANVWKTETEIQNSGQLRLSMCGSFARLPFAHKVNGQVVRQVAGTAVNRKSKNGEAIAAGVWDHAGTKYGTASSKSMPCRPRLCGLSHGNRRDNAST